MFTPKRALPLVLFSALAALPGLALAEQAVAPVRKAADEPSLLDRRIASLFNPASGLTSDEVARRAEATSIDVRIKEQAIAAAQARTRQAVLGWVPIFQMSARYTRLSDLTLPSLGSIGGDSGSLVGAPGSIASSGQLVAPGTPLVRIPPISLSFPIYLNVYDFKASLSVPISDYVLRVSQGIASASHSERAARIDEKAARLKIAADARVAYYQWIRARGQLVVAEQSLEQARGHLTDAKRAFEVGMVSKADVLRAESQTKAVELFVERAQSFVALAEEQLRVSMHDDGSRRFDIGEDLRVELPKVAGAENVEQLQAEAFEKRLELRALDATAWSLKEQEKIVRASNYPRLDAQGNANYTNPHPRIFPQQDKFTASWDLSLVLSWTPTELLGTSARSDELEQRRLQVETQKLMLRDGLRLEVTQAQQALRESELALETTAAGRMASEEAYRVRRELFRNGRATTVEVTDAETELTRARLEAINAHIDARVARVRLNHALGRDVPNGG